MARFRPKSEAARLSQAPAPAPAAAYGTAREDFRVPGPHGLVVFESGKRVLVEPQVRRLMGADAPITWEDE